ncbi:MAG: hypothetical protein ACSLFK_00345 [Gemmatimonadaceae bacterium]
MYRTCIFCHSSLGGNEAIESFPIGRRLAFDSNKGRLWAVCAKCGRWNLTPIEQRWEAIEECEREFRAARKRTSTDEIGLGRLGEGTDLIRIGKPLRPEFAAWRYGANIRKRARTTAISAGTGIVVLGAVFLGAPVFLAPLVGILPAFALALPRQAEVRSARRYMLKRASMIAGRRIWDDKQIEIRIVPSDYAQGWALRFFGFTMPVDIHGPEALHTVNKIMPALNLMGGTGASVKRAVSEIEASGAPERYFQRVIEHARENRMTYTPINGFPSEMRLAVEMAANEETERRALVEGELKQLEEAWREAEEIAAIADDMFVPKEITEFIERHRPS